MSLVQIERATGNPAVSVIKLDRPKVNALNTELIADLDAACAEVSSDDSVRAVVVYGGERTFSAGADLKEMAEGTPDDVRRRVGALQKLCDRIEDLELVTIAAVNGYALGGGCELALACDFRVASAEAKLGQPEIVVGLIPGAGGTQRLPRLIGPARAKALIYTGDFVDAKTAEGFGLVDAVADGDAITLALEWAERFAKGPTKSLAAAKRAIQRGLSSGLRGGLDDELDEFVGLFSTRDTQHGLASFANEGPGKAQFEGH
jgi:enoyl-CoA hydratase/carnithine racemase